MQRLVRPLKANVHDAAGSWDGRALEDGWASERDGESEDGQAFDLDMSPQDGRRAPDLGLRGL